MAYRTKEQNREYMRDYRRRKGAKPVRRLTPEQKKAEKAAYAREWRKKHRDRINAEDRQRRKERRAAETPKEREARCEKVRGGPRKPRTNRWALFKQTFRGKAYHRVAAAKSRAKRKGLPFDLDLDWYLEHWNKGCAITGIPFTHDRKDPFVCHIDQIEPGAGYTKENCQLVVAIYNKMKSDYSVDQVADFLRRLKN